MRIIAGRLGGRRLPARVPPGTRPTGDRVREALFAMLEARGAIADARVLDLFAGTGALGLEALSRGARIVTAVDRDPRAIAAIRHNAKALDVSAEVHCVRADVDTLTHAGLAKHGASGPFDLILIDSPYAELELVGRWLTRLARAPWLAEDGVLSLEMAARSDLQLPENLFEIRRQRYGDSAIVLLSPIA